MGPILNFIADKRLLINTDKTFFLVAHSSYAKINIENKIILSNGIAIMRVVKAKHLGLIIDEHLKWDAHCEHLSKKVSSASGILWKMRRRLPFKIKKNIYHTLLETHLNYMIVIWGSASDVAINSIQTAQNRALRNVYGRDRRENRIEMYLHHTENCLPLRAIHFVSTASFIYNAIHHNTRTNLTFPWRTSLFKRDTGTELRITDGRTNYGKRSIFHLGIMIFNSIPAPIKQLKHAYAFKWALRCNLRKKEFISTCFSNEYLKGLS
jgi:hypothetical protein